MTSEQFPWLTSIILLPIVAALPIPLIPDKDGRTVRWYSLFVGLADFALMVYAFWQHFDRSEAGLQMVEKISWVPQIGLNWSLAVDGLSMPLVLLTGLVTTLAILASWNINVKPKLFHFLLLLLYGAQIAVFTAQDMMLFFLVWELELVPVYLLISIWGGPKRQYAATKFILYTALASLFILVAGLALAFSGDSFSFDLTELGLKNYSFWLELLAYAGFLIAFGVKLSVFPLHTWLPDAHGEANAPGSMLLAGILLKMGGYALIRFNVQLLPEAHIHFAPVLAVLGIVNIIYGAFNAFAQDNLKRKIAYSSISHMGFVLLGIAAYNSLGLNGALLQMLSHGLIAAALFFLAGVAYERTHTLQIPQISGLAKQMPVTFALFTATAMASLALPGMSGFVSELTVFLGFTDSVYSSGFRTVTILLAAVGLILTPMYLLSMLRRIFYGNYNLQLGQVLADAKPRELFITFCLLIPTLAIGFYPKLTTQVYDATTTALAAQVQANLPTVALAQQGSLYSQMPTGEETTAVSMVSAPVID
ncbi:NAD(P)H-quinone oxidoreductase subunit 4 [Synechococcus elongatus]|uniref:NAD(P)H-quinone oxidoreductase subunit 4 n=1 Tax=Synechococcus elongatus TaxID=32046 RepID=UPI0030CAE7AC